MSSYQRQRFIGRIGGNFQFFRAWLGRPRLIGSVIPTGTFLAQRMASVVDPEDPHPVLELGPGTGAITHAILQRGIKPSKLTAVEYDPDFAKKMRSDFPGIALVQGSAFELDSLFGQAGNGAPVFQCAISALPLLNFPVEQRIMFIEHVLDYVRPGGVLVQFSYGRSPPVPQVAGSYDVTFAGRVIRNIPPARLWTYSKKTLEKSETG